MREILFRGKTKGGKWVEGYYVKVDHYINYSEIHVIIPTNTILYPRREFSDYVEVIPETVGQFTGLYDQNGVKIFEGDIVQNEYGFNRRVTWYKGRFTPFIAFPEYYCWDHESCKVIGNIHDDKYKIKEEG